MKTNQLIEGPAVWYGAELARSEAWIHRLSPAEIDEIEAAMATVLDQGLPIIEVRPEDFPLPTLGQVLAEIRNEVVNGRGFALIKGLPVERYTRQEAVLAYWGLGLYLGQAVPQNAKGHALGHVKDIGHDPHNPLHRVYATNYRQLYHTDSCDVVALLCLQPAKVGGLSSLVSSTTIYNEMMKQRPDLVKILKQPFFVDRKGEIPVGKEATYQMAIYHEYGGHLTAIYARDFITAAQRHEDVPRLTPAQLEAMDMLDNLAASEALRLDMTLEAGDIQVLHNHQILHARTGYEDYPEPERKRHLLRLWLSQSDGRPLPPVFAERYGNIQLGTRRGGIFVPGAVENVPLEAE